MSVDFTPYLKPTRFSAARGVILAARLIKAAPVPLNPRPREALQRVRVTAVDLQTVATDTFFATQENLRPLDGRVDGGYMALREGLSALARLEGRPEAERAAVLLARVLPSGARFITASYEEQFFRSKITLERIDQEGLAAEIDELLGEAYLEYIRSAHDDFGEAMGLGEGEVAPEVSGSIREAIAALADAIADYGRILVGEVDLDDPESVARFRAAVAPIDRYRESRSRSGDAPRPEEPPVTDAPPEEDVQPTDPVPPVPA